ncbi:MULTISPECIES: hypothetical protein [unclassified Gordonia (in: high G+C Gram-positive bacteria)]|uniref:hypothetical protein n=1 Tax=unclassified Gordonia (in: high G+C Gram-positive bacteria) TaxID=2657482 RepID=UPI001F0FE048|nr:hypothetical protein [Gordonia sp. ABSL49_1]MCH5643213.1 hypothetical protein [Gordonia sp. ABSL49_1]
MDTRHSGSSDDVGSAEPSAQPLGPDSASWQYGNDWRGLFGALDAGSAASGSE